MADLSRLCLGTAQFGASYGISNVTGAPSEAAVRSILEHAAPRIGYIDTAPAYGEAETLIGRYLPHDHGLRIVTKLPPIADGHIASHHVHAAIATLEQSLARMRIDRAYAVLLHHADDMAKPGSELLAAALLEARARGLVQRVGASVYDAEQIATVRERLQVDLVQVPFNILDRRLATSGALAKLKADGIEIHARSIFLQGLLLMEPRRLPDHLAPLRHPLEQLRERWRRQGVSPVSACVDFVLRHEFIDVAIVGVNQLAELREIEGAANLSEPLDHLYADFAIDPAYLNPARWPSLAA